MVFRKQFYLTSGWKIFHIIITIPKKGGGHAYDSEVYARTEHEAIEKTHKEILKITDNKNTGDTFEFRGDHFITPCNITFKKGPLKKLRHPLDAFSTSLENYYPGDEEYDENEYGKDY